MSTQPTPAPFLATDFIASLSRKDSEELTNAIRRAAFWHGRNFKSAIRHAWFHGDYRKQGLSDFSGILQRLRNSRHGHDWLESLHVKDWVPSAEVARIMGRNAFADGDSNPFGLETLSKAWRKGYAEAKEAFDDSPTGRI